MIKASSLTELHDMDRHRAPELGVIVEGGGDTMRSLRVSATSCASNNGRAFVYTEQTLCASQGTRKLAQSTRHRSLSPLRSPRCCVQRFLPRPREELHTQRFGDCTEQRASRPSAEHTLN